MNKVKLWQLCTFSLLWLAYASTYLLRKPLGLVKGDVQTELRIPASSLGWLDTALLLPYAGVSLLFGGLGDRLGPRVTLGFGMLIAAAANAPIGSRTQFYEILVLLFISGAGQALCWPAACSLISKWFSEDIRSTIFGLFGSSCFVGGIGGTAVAVYLQMIYGWRGEFMIPSLVVATLAVLVLTFAREPNQRNLPMNSDLNVKYSDNERANGLSFRDVWKLPNVPEISLAMFCIKAIRYAMIMWLPLYLTNIHGYSKEMAGLASTSFEIGGMVGSLSIGIVVDKIFKGKSVYACFLSCLVSGISLIGLNFTQQFGPAGHIFWLAIAGATNCAPDVILAGSVATKIGEPHGAASAVTATVNGMGSLGTVIEGPLVALIAEWFGFSYMFPMMIIISIVATILCHKAHLNQLYAYKYELAASTVLP